MVNKLYIKISDNTKIKAIGITIAFLFFAFFSSVDIFALECNDNPDLPECKEQANEAKENSGSKSEFNARKSEYKELEKQGMFKYLKNPNQLSVFEITSTLIALIRVFGFWIITLLYNIAQILLNVFNSITQNFNYFEIIFNNSIGLFTGAFSLALLIGIVVAGLKIANPLKEGSDIVKMFVKGLIASVGMFALVGFTFITMEKTLQATSQQLLNNGKTNVISQLANNYIIDVQSTFESKKIKYLEGKDINYIDINEPIKDPKSDVLEYKYFPKNDKGVYDRVKLQKVNSSILFNIESGEQHYKYSFNFIMLAITLGGICLIILFNALKFVRNIFEMFGGFLMIIGQTVNVANLEQKKQIISNILGLFFSNLYCIASVFFVINSLMIVNLMLPNLLAGQGIIEQSLITLIIYIALFSWAMNGDSIIQQLTGTDASLRSGKGMLMAGLGIGALGTKALSKTSKVAGDVAKTAGKGTKAGVGMAGKAVSATGLDKKMKNSKLGQKANNLKEKGQSGLDKLGIGAGAKTLNKQKAEEKANAKKQSELQRANSLRDRKEKSSNKNDNKIGAKSEKGSSKSISNSLSSGARTTLSNSSSNLSNDNNYSSNEHKGVDNSFTNHREDNEFNDFKNKDK